jgi:non-specific serine/threonine protein kinase
MTSFVGRRHELTDVKRQLASSRLVTLTGIGGVGKTRLALRVAAEARRTFEDSVWLVEFGDLTDPTTLAESVASAIGLIDRTNRPAEHVLEEFLALRRALLIFDNCEHLLDAAAALTKSLLRATDDLKILATSREPLNIDGEAVVRVPPLTIPEIAQVPVPGYADIAVGDAVTLFAERARSHVPGFALTPDNVDAVMRICQRLDGLPLPIELAAARLRTLSVTQILEHLTDRYRLLTAGRRAAPSRQQTLRASVDWSRELCSPEEQRLWARISVFAGGAQLDAIEAVCSDGRSDVDVLDLVGSLVDKSIVIREEPDTEVRYRMLETLRDYGRSDLLSSGEYAEVRRRHRQWYFDLACRAANEWVGADRPSWAVRLTRDHANLREAMDFCFESGDSDTGLLIATALYPYWLTCGRFTEGRRWLGRAADATDADESSRARALLLDAVLTGVQGDTAAATQLLKTARSLADTSELTTALMQYASGYVELYCAEPGAAAAHFETSASTFRAYGEVFFEWGSLEGLGLAHVISGRMEEAARTLNDALAITATGEKPDLHAYPLWALAIALWHQDDIEHAIAAVRRGVEISRCGDPLALAYSLQVLAWIAADNGREQSSAVLLGAADTLWHQLGSTILIFPAMGRFQDRCDDQLRTKLGTKEVAAARKRGAAMSRAQAAAFALDEEPPSASAQGELMKLTKREREVAALVAQGLTNRAIADSLVVSQRTAQGHVENILMKLGFSSRAQIAAWMAQQQVATQPPSIH